MQTRSMTKRMAQTFEEVKTMTTTWTESGLRFRHAVLWNVHHFRKLGYGGVDISLTSLHQNYGLPHEDSNPTKDSITAMIFFLLTKGYTVYEWHDADDMPLTIQWVKAPDATTCQPYTLHLPFTDDLEPLVVYPPPMSLD